MALRLSCKEGENLTELIRDNRKLLSNDKISKLKLNKHEVSPVKPELHAGSLFDIEDLEVGESEFELNGYNYKVIKKMVRPNVVDYVPEDIVWENCYCPRSRGALMQCTCYSFKKTCQNCNRPFRTYNEVKYCVTCRG